MGRLPALSLALACWFGLGCQNEERKTAFTTRERSQAVQTTATAAGGPTTTTATAAALSERPARARRALCGGKLAEGRALPKRRLSQASASDAADLSELLVPAKSGFTWINFWAAWCAPCKEEIPRLNAWKRKLAGGRNKLSVEFVSLDDDERQLRGFLEASPELRRTYWLKEGIERDEWMSAAGLSPDPELPIHLLVDSHGKIRCTVQGAVEDSDFPDLVRLLDG